MPTRREFLAGLGAVAVVVGFDLRERRWVTAAEAARGCDFNRVPPLDGELLQDRAARAEASHDLGNIAHVEPCAVLQPGSVLDIQKMIRFCRAHGIKVSARGAGHTMFGQSLSPGLMIQMRCLRTIHSIGPPGADVDAGVLWPELLRAAYEQRLRPPATFEEQRVRETRSNERRMAGSHIQRVVNAQPKQLPLFGDPRVNERKLIR